MRKIMTMLFGFIPWVAGIVLYNLMMTVFYDVRINFYIVGTFSLIFWGLLACVVNHSLNNSIVTTVLLNIPAFVALLLITVERIILYTNWGGIVGLFTGRFFFPVLSLGFWITKWNGSLGAAYYASFFLMLLASFIGCYLGNIWDKNQAKK